jgi:aspartyl/asparaginyl beta-hydroxylase (cupin superfamily)
MEPTATNIDRPAQSRAFLEQWAESYNVARSNLQRLFTAVDRWTPGTPLVLPDLDARTFYDPQRFGWMEDLVRIASALRAELAALSDELAPHPESATLVEQGSWRAWFLWRSGRQVARNAAAAPTAAKTARLGPGGGQAGNTYYSVIQPGTRLRRHTGPFNGRLRCHLGLDVPDSGCQIEIAGEYRSWCNDECLVFSDFPPHSVVNAGASARAVYVLDFWHPGLAADECNALAALLAGRL